MMSHPCFYSSVRGFFIDTCCITFRNKRSAESQQGAFYIDRGMSPEH